MVLPIETSHYAFVFNQILILHHFLAFFHPYGEVAQIQVINQGDTIPENVMKWCQKDNLEPSHSAIVEFQTARTAKFVVGVLRKRLSQLNFRYFLLKYHEQK